MFSQSFIEDTIVTYDEADFNELCDTLRGKAFFLDAIQNVFDLASDGDHYPPLVIECVGIPDIQVAMRFAHLHNLSFAIRRKNATVSAETDMLIDLSRFKGVYVYFKKRTLWAQSGATIGEIDQYAHVFGLPISEDDATALTGAELALGQAKSYFERTEGLTANNLIAVDLVTLDGTCITASATENSDIFHAILAGDEAVGVVTMLKYRIYPISNETLFEAPCYSFDQARDVLSAWRAYMEDADGELVSGIDIWTVPPTANFPTQYHGQTLVILPSVYCGANTKASQALHPLSQLGGQTPLLTLSGLVDFQYVQKALQTAFYRNNRANGTHYEVSSLSDDVLVDLLDYAVNESETRIFASLQRFTQALWQAVCVRTSSTKKTSWLTTSYWDEDTTLSCPLQNYLESLQLLNIPFTADTYISVSDS